MDRFFSRGLDLESEWWLGSGRWSHKGGDGVVVNGDAPTSNSLFGWS